MKFINIILKCLFTFLIINEFSAKLYKIMKKIQTKGPSNASKYATNKFDLETISKIVQVHNNLRSDVANGKASGVDGILPSASDMMQIYWDEQIAAKAQQWTNRCEFNHSPQDYRTIGNMDLGENIFMSSSSDTSVDPNTMDWESAIKDWYSEIKDYKKDTVNSFNSDGPAVIGHFSQVIWSNTYLVGCGLCSFINSDGLNQIYLCEYGQAGNMIGSPNYKTGTPASQCSSGFQSSTTYNGLCCKTGACENNSIQIKGDFSSVQQSIDNINSLDSKKRTQNENERNYTQIGMKIEIKTDKLINKTLK